MINAAQMLMWSAASRINGGGGGGGGGSGILSSFVEEDTMFLFSGSGSGGQGITTNTSGTQILVTYSSGSGTYLGITGDGVNWSNVNLPEPMIPQISQPTSSYPNRWVFSFNNNMYYCDDLFTSPSPTFYFAQNMSGIFIQKMITSNDMYHAVGISYSAPNYTCYYINSSDGINWVEYPLTTGPMDVAFLMYIAASSSHIMMSGFPPDAYYIDPLFPSNPFSTLTMNKSLGGGGNPQGIQGSDYSPLQNKFIFGADLGKIYVSTALAPAVEVDLNLHPVSSINMIMDVIWNPTLNHFLGLANDSSLAKKVIKSSDGITWDVLSHPTLDNAQYFTKAIWSPAYNKYYTTGARAAFVGSFQSKMYIASFTI